MAFDRKQDTHVRSQGSAKTSPLHRPRDSFPVHQHVPTRSFTSVDPHSASRPGIQNHPAPAHYYTDLPRQHSDVRRSQQLERVREAARNRTSSQLHQSVSLQQGQHLTHQRHTSRKSDPGRSPFEAKTPKSTDLNEAGNHLGSRAGLSAVGRPPSHFSRDEAAVAIQAAWRGHQVRASKPLEVGKTILELRKLARDMEERLDDKDFVGKVTSDPREKLRATETIMCWLLRLDEVQSPNQEVRVLRRDMARKLNELLDRVESLGAVKEAASNANDTRSIRSDDPPCGSFMGLVRFDDTASANTLPEQAQKVPENATDRDIGGADCAFSPRGTNCALSPDSSMKEGRYKRKSVSSSIDAGGGKAERGVGDEGGRTAKRRKRRTWRDMLWRWKESLGGLCGRR